MEKKIFKNTSPKNLQRWQISIWKEAKLHGSLGKEIKTTIRYHCLPIKMAKLRRLTIPRVHEI